MPIAHANAAKLWPGGTIKVHGKVQEVPKPINDSGGLFRGYPEDDQAENTKQLDAVDDGAGKGHPSV
jgi:hypothetical protein